MQAQEGAGKEEGKGIAGAYFRGNFIQVDNFTVEGNPTGGPAVKLFQQDVLVSLADKTACVAAATCTWLGPASGAACDSESSSCLVRYGGQVELKGLVVKDQNETTVQDGVSIVTDNCVALVFHRNEMVESTTVYGDYSIGDCELVASGIKQKKPIAKEASAFAEMVWADDGGDNACFERAITPTWNLLSLPMKQVEPAVATVLDQVKDQLSSAWKWDNGNWAVFLPSFTPAEFAAYLETKGFPP